MITEAGDRIAVQRRKLSRHQDVFGAVKQPAVPFRFPIRRIQIERLMRTIPETGLSSPAKARLFLSVISGENVTRPGVRSPTMVSRSMRPTLSQITKQIVSFFVRCFVAEMIDA